MSNAKGTIYKFLKVWNDLSALKKGKVTKRIGRRTAGKLTSKGFRKLF